MKDKFKMPDFIEGSAKYIICPDMKCKGFLLDHLQCQTSKTTLELFPNCGYKLCPHLDTAKKVVFCSYGHPIESKVNSSNWQRADCTYKDCYSSTFTRMSNITYRIPLDKYEEFLKLSYKQNN
jgi:hypothetical protein